MSKKQFTLAWVVENPGLALKKLINQREHAKQLQNCLNYYYKNFDDDYDVGDDPAQREFWDNANAEFDLTGNGENDQQQPKR